MGLLFNTGVFRFADTSREWPCEKEKERELKDKDNNVWPFGVQKTLALVQYLRLYVLS